MKAALFLFALSASALAADVSVQLTGQEMGVSAGNLNTPANTVPEPSSLWLLAIAGVALWKLRK